MDRKKYTCYFITNNHGQSEEELTEARRFMDSRFIQFKEESKYIIWCQEIGRKNGRHHEHLYVRFKSARSFKAIQKLFPNSNVDRARGNDVHNQNYLKKGGTFWESGAVSSQGRRTDLERIRSDIMDGRTVTSILREEPYIYHVFGRTIEALRDVYNRNVHRSERTLGVWYYGGTGTGKSQAAYMGYSADTHYVKTLEDGDKKWWDGYCGQDCVIFDEFRGEYEMSFMLRLTDRYPLNVARRGRESRPFNSKKVIVTSCYHPHHIYKDETNKTMKQLYRRFEIIKMNWWHGESSLFIENINPENRLMNFPE